MKGPSDRTKVVVQHLPPAISQSAFTEQIDGLFSGLYNWVYFSHGKNRFHVLQEFDEGKRSCRRRLAGHNKRRRKTQPDAVVNSSLNDDQASGSLLISLLRIISNMHSNRSNPTSANITSCKLCFLEFQELISLFSLRNALRYKTAIKADPLCYEALERLIENHMLTCEEETSLLLSLQFTPEDGWISSFYSCLIKKFSRTSESVILDIQRRALLQTA